MAFALFLSAKWLTLIDLLNIQKHPRRLLAYFFLWPGMDARNFCGNHQIVPPRNEEYWGPITKLAAGLTLFGIAAFWASRGPTIVVGWVAMIGIVLFLHFGLVHLRKERAQKP